ncbi:MAG: zinc-binding protein [Chloroflexi bacterium RBG_16_57_8]|nr:MAG: zinc-binding protein [Chloroflexi bacterium RBG_16_57_8]
MALEERTLNCSDCGADFAFTVEEQELFKTKGYTNEPKRCPACRAARKAKQATTTGGSSYGFGGGYNSGGFGNRGGYTSARREMFPAKCAECGKDTQVPFQPRGDRPVYCSDCYRKVKPAR